MDQPISDTQDNDSFDSSWESTGEDLIPIENDHLSEDVREAEQRADAQLEADGARHEESTEAFDQEYGQETLVEPDVPQEVEPEPVEEIVDDPPPASDGHARGEVIVSDQGFGERVESGVEKPGQNIWGVIQESESESGRRGERLG